MDQVTDAILSRRSVRAYTSQPVDPLLIRAVLEAGLSAPSAHDSRPWHFAVIASPEGKARLLAALAAPFRRDMEAAGLPQEAVSARLARSQGIFRSAPVLILSFSPAALPENRLDPSGTLEEVMAIQSGALAGGQMLLAAHALGLGMCWFAAPLFCPEEACAACGLSPAQWRPRYLLTLGYPAPGAVREKPPVDMAGSVTFL